MKKVLLMMSVLLSIGMFFACSSDDNVIGDFDTIGDIEEQPSTEGGEEEIVGKSFIPVPLPGTIIPVLPAYSGHEYILVYEPVSYEELPEWFKSRLDPEKPATYQLYQGEYNGDIVYDVQSLLFSVIRPYLYDKDGKELEGDLLDIYEKINKWVLIYVENPEIGIFGSFPL